MTLYPEGTVLPACSSIGSAAPEDGALGHTRRMRLETVERQRVDDAAEGGGELRMGDLQLAHAVAEALAQRFGGGRPGRRGKQGFDLVRELLHRATGRLVELTGAGELRAKGGETGLE